MAPKLTKKWICHIQRHCCYRYLAINRDITHKKSMIKQIEPSLEVTSLVLTLHVTGTSGCRMIELESLRSMTWAEGAIEVRGLNAVRQKFKFGSPSTAVRRVRSVVVIAVTIGSRNGWYRKRKDERHGRKLWSEQNRCRKRKRKR